MNTRLLRISFRISSAYRAIARKKRGLAIKKRRAIWTTTARLDVVNDHDYIALRSPVAADRFSIEIFAKVRSLSNLGLTGVDRPDCGEGVRSIAYRERIIFFRVSDIALTILRVLHGHQDISPDLFTDITD